MDQVIWAMASRCNPIDDIDILRNTWSTWLDPTQNPPEKRPYGSKALINACKEHRHLPVFSKRTTLRKKIYDQVAARWTELGLSGQAPAVRAFEAENTVTYHEVGGLTGLAALIANPPGNFNIRPVPKAGGRLVDRGPYRWIRHPMYSALLAVGLACALAAAGLAGWIAYAALVAVLAVKAGIEEQGMLQHHPDYAAYRARTKRFVPGVI